jgi:hypothetical protein
VQCKEQSNDMLQKACLIVENSVKEGNNMNLADVFFEVAKRWDELYVESMRNNSQNQNINQPANELLVDPAILSSSISSSCLQQQAAVAAAAAAASNYIQQPPLMQQQPMNMIDPMVHQQFSYIQTSPQQPPQTAPFAFQVQTLPYPQYLASQSTTGIQNTGPMQNMFIPHMYTAYGTIVSNSNVPQTQNIIYAPQNQNHPYPVPPMNVYPANNTYIFQNQMSQMMPNPNNQIPMQHQQIPQKPLEVLS